MPESKLNIFSKRTSGSWYCGGDSVTGSSHFGFFCRITFWSDVSAAVGGFLFVPSTIFAVAAVVQTSPMIVFFRRLSIDTFFDLGDFVVD